MNFSSSKEIKIFTIRFISRFNNSFYRQSIFLLKDVFFRKPVEAKRYDFKAVNYLFDSEREKMKTFRKKLY